MAIAMARKSLLMVRVDAGFNSQQELAKEAGLDATTVWKAENGRIVTWRTKRKIVNALKRRGVQVEVEDIDWTAKEQP